ncbi:MAG: PQQ-dependent sugar dehydrogenase [Deltaproteobacteria bacterium]|nr:PQQ-dependent sugar dehydrogenase [Deltaproteobacteria bacterium]
MISHTVSLPAALLVITLWTAPLCGASPVHTPGQEPCVVQEETLPPLPAVKLKSVAEGLNNPLHLTHASGGTGRLFVVEQAGLIRIVKRGTLLKKPFLDIRNRVSSGGEKGLLSVAFHPDFSENGRLFVNYTSSRGGLHTVISEFHTGRSSDFADSGSERIILEVAQPFSNHNGGQIAFGPDGYLYIGMGDGGSGNDPKEHGQNLSTLLAAMLRIDVDRREDGREYGIPEDNPFKRRKRTRPEIWAYGLRNPWRFSFDPVTGLLYAGDVGQNAREEVDVIKGGKNYGWRIMEGAICTPGIRGVCNKKGLTLPIIDYGRSEGISVIGGVVYRGDDMPALCGAYLYGDWGSGKIWSLRYGDGGVTGQRLLLDTDLNISSFGTDENYEVYVVDRQGGIYRVEGIYRQEKSIIK